MISPDQRWLPFLKMGLGFALLLVLALLAAVIALGKVQQNTSYGLQDLLGGLLVLAGAFSQWAFAPAGGKEKADVANPDNPAGPADSVSRGPAGRLETE